MSWAFSPLLPAAAELLPTIASIEGSASLSFSAVGYTDKGIGVRLGAFRSLTSGIGEVLGFTKPTALSGISGSAALTFGSTAGLAGTGALAGSGDLVLSEGTSTLTGIGSLVGSGALAFDGLLSPTAGSIAGSASLSFGGTLSWTPSGSAVLTFGGVSFGSTLNPIIGHSDLVFQQLVTPLLGKIVPISGSSSLAFGASATGGISGNSGLGSRLRHFDGFRSTWFDIYVNRNRQSQSIIASSSMSFGASGILSASSTGFTAQGDLAFGGQGLLKGVGALAGSADLVFDSTSSLTTGAMIGSASLTFSAQLGYGLAAVEGITVSATGTLTGVGNLQGSSAITMPASATLGVTGMFGSARLTFSASMGPRFVGIGQPINPRYSVLYPYSSSAALLGPRNPIQSKLVGSAALQFGNAAVLGGIGYISGSASLSFDGSGTATGATSASASMIFDATATPRADGYMFGFAFLTLSAGSSGVPVQPNLGSSILQFSATGRLIHKGSWVEEDDVTGSWQKQSALSDGWGKQSTLDSDWIKQTGT